MFSTNDFLPFLNRSRTVGLRNEIIDNSRVILFNQPENVGELADELGSLINFVHVPFYYERNLNAYIPMCRTRLEYLAIAVKVKFGHTIKGHVVEIDYSDVARNIQTEEITDSDGEVGSTLASLNVAHGELTATIVDDRFITLAANRVSWDLSESEEDNVAVFTESINLHTSKYTDEQLNEAFTLNPNVNVQNTSTANVKVDTKDPYEEYIYNYIKSDKLLTKNRVPLLIGTTAVAKSSLIKAIVKQLDTGRANGYRLIDFRAAFIDKNDIEGFATKLKDSNNEYFAEMSPMRELIEATDEYLDYAQATLDGIEQKMQTLMNAGDMDTYDGIYAAYKSAEPGSPQFASARQALKDFFTNYEADVSTQIRQLAELRRLYTEKAKTPVLFFDEITRAPKEARNAFTTILNQKMFLNYKISRARIVAATNFPVGMPEEYIMVYTTEEIDDIAALERFEPFVVMPKDVYPRWNKWATGNLHEAVVKFIETNPDKYAYALDTVMDTIDNNPDMDEYNAAELPFPNFRTWEFVSNYIKSIEQQGQKFDMVMIVSLIGTNRVSKDLHDFLKKNYPKLMKDEIKPNQERDVFEENLRAGILAGVPVLLSGPTSYGKTTRVKNVAKEIDAVLIEINLATKDATQIKGIPTPIPVADTVLYGSNINLDSVSDDIRALLQDTRKYGVAGNTTDYMPDKYVRDMLLEASRTGRPVILFFDEVNRCDKTVLSSVFEAVSDDRYMGVTFKPGQVKVVCAANLGSEYGDVTQLDPAFAARFSMVRKDQYDMFDVKSFKKYVDSTEKDGTRRYHKVVAEFIKDQDDDDVLDAMKSVEERTLLRAVPSLRAWHDISEMVTNAEKDNPFGGKVVFNVSTSQGQVLSKVSTSPSWKSINVGDAERALNTFPPNWTGHLSDSPITISGLGTYTPREWMEGAKMIVAQLKDPSVNDATKDNYFSQLKAMLAGMKDLEVKLLRNRKTMIEAKLGTDFDIVERFFEYYNSVSGDSIIELKDLVDESLIEPYMQRRMGGMASDQLIAACADFSKEFVDYFKTSLSSSHYQTVIRVSHDLLRHTDQMIEWWASSLKATQFKDLVTKASEGDKQFTYDTLNRLGIAVNQYKQEIENYYA